MRDDFDDDFEDFGMDLMYAAKGMLGWNMGSKRGRSCGANLVAQIGKCFEQAIWNPSETPQVGVKHMLKIRRTRNSHFITSYGQSSYCGILPVLWDGPLLCSEVVEDKSPIIDVVETYMKLI